MRITLIFISIFNSNLLFVLHLILMYINCHKFVINNIETNFIPIGPEIFMAILLSELIWMNFLLIPFYKTILNYLSDFSFILVYFCTNMELNILSYGLLALRIFAFLICHNFTYKEFFNMQHAGLSWRLNLYDGV